MIITFPVAFGLYTAYWGLFRPNVRFPWQVRALLAFAYLAVFWLVIADVLPGDAYLQMTAPLVAAAIACATGAGSLIAAWRAWPPRGQPRGARHAGDPAGGRGRDDLGAGQTRAAGPFAAALVAIAVLAHKTPAADLAGGALVLRDALMRYGWVMLFSVAAEPDMSLIFLFYLVFLAPGLLIAAARRFGAVKPGKRLAALRTVGNALLRFGWLAGAPFLVVALTTHATAPLVGAGVWLLTGVATTLAALVPAPKRPRPAVAG